MRRLPIFFSTVALAGAVMGPANATVFDFATTDVSVQQLGTLAPTSDFIGGTITLSNSVLPGEQFSSANVTALFLTFLGVTGTLTDVQNDPGLGGGPVQLTGTLSSDGKSFSTFEFDGGFQASVSPQCGFACGFTIHVNSVGGPDNTSNFIDADVTALETLNIATYTPHFTAVTSAVPEPSTWAMLIMGFAGIGAMTYRRRKTAALAASSKSRTQRRPSGDPFCLCALGSRPRDQRS
jgi:hypothetical protein